MVSVKTTLSDPTPDTDYKVAVFFNAHLMTG